MKPVNIFFLPNEAKIIGLGLASVIEDLNEARSNHSIPWTPEARKEMDDMYKSAKNAASKIEKFCGIKCDLPPYNEGDEKEFFTKES